MANVITTLLKMDSTQFKTGLKGAQQSIKETDGVVAKAKAGWASAFAGFASSPAAIGVATAAIGSFAVASVAAASDLEESINAVNVTFGDSADKILAFGENAAKSVGLAKAEFNELATPLGSILKNAGFQLDEVADKTITLTQRAADMASVFNTDVSESLNAIQAGLRGEQDPLERFGVSLSAAKVEARALADSGKENAKQLTDQEKQLARINLILDQTNQTAGDFANTSDGLANQTRILKAEFTNLEAAAGQELIPKLSALAAVLIEAKDAADLLGGAIKKIPGADGGGGALDFLDVARGSFDPIKQIENINNAWGDLKDSFSGGSGDSPRIEVDRFRDSINQITPAQEAATNAAAATADAVADLGDKAANSGPKIGDMAGALKDAREHLADLNEQARNNTLDILANAAQGVADALDAAFGSLEDDLSSLDLLDDITDQFDKVAEASKEANDPQGVRDMNREIRRLQGELLDYLQTVKGIPPDKVTEIIAKIRTGDIDTLKTVLDDLTQDRFINIGVRADPKLAFASLNGVFTPGAAPAAPTFNQPNPAPQTTDARTIINYYPVGSTPTTVFQDQQTDFRRNGAR